MHGRRGNVAGLVRGSGGRGSAAAGKQVQLYITLLVVLIVAFIASLPIWPYNRKWDSLPAMGVGIALAVLALMLYMGRL